VRKSRTGAKAAASLAPEGRGESREEFERDRFGETGARLAEGHTPQDALREQLERFVCGLSAEMAGVDADGDFCCAQTLSGVHERLNAILAAMLPSVNRCPACDDVPGWLQRARRGVAFLRENNRQLWDRDAGSLDHCRTCTDPNDLGCRYLQAVEAIEVALASVGSGAVPPWQPIATAPKDGTYVWLWNGYRRSIGWFKSYQDGSSGWHHQSVVGEPLYMRHIDPDTHWLSLPAPPASETPEPRR